MLHKRIFTLITAVVMAVAVTACGGSKNMKEDVLDGFKLGADGLSSTVIIRDVSGQEFKTSHNIVVETVLKSVQEILDVKIAEVEKQIDFAERYRPGSRYEGIQQ